MEKKKPDLFEDIAPILSDYLAGLEIKHEAEPEETDKKDQQD